MSTSQSPSHLLHGIVGEQLRTLVLIGMPGTADMGFPEVEVGFLDKSIGFTDGDMGAGTDVGDGAGAKFSLMQ